MKKRGGRGKNQLHLKIIYSKKKHKLLAIINNSLTTFFSDFFFLEFFGILVRTLSLTVCKVSIDDRHVVSIQLGSVSVHVREAKLGRLSRSCRRTDNSVNLASYRVALWRKLINQYRQAVRAKHITYQYELLVTPLVCSPRNLPHFQLQDCELSHLQTHTGIEINWFPEK